ncbi:MAG: glycosyltransferase family 4 protein [Sulfurimonas sp.]|nr:glycosyltransferase family 4 protein [Sulfurimonas sp.]MBU3938884.1 glycosyltransferase family 4 protein [bacterium]MBU4059842.1 glycosyltransferase family 4 protein [bacterium]
MKICHITHGRVNPDGENGITRTVYSLNKYLNANGVESSIYSFNDNQAAIEDFKRDEFTTVKLFPRAKLFKSKEFSDFILSDEFDFDIVHFHLMWMIDKNTILAALKKRNIPYIMTVHGAYAPNLIDTMKKYISMKTLEGRYIAGAKGLHALCFEEKAYLKNLNLKSPIYVIPNGISQSEIEKIQRSKNLENPFDNNYINLIWVGRIREDKNVLGIVESLLYLNDEIKNKVRIHIVGNGIESYIEKVKNMIEINNLEKNVIFHGPKYKEEKYQYILNADIYLQPSFSEGISFSILDAMACAKPMILTRQTNMTYYYNKNFYIMTEPYPEDIADAIDKLASNEAIRNELATNAKNLIETTFNWDSLIGEYIGMYKKVIGE